MTTLRWVVVLGLGGATLAFTAYAGVVGRIGAVFSERFERCRRSGRHGLSVRTTLHSDGCPPRGSIAGLGDVLLGWAHVHWRHQ